MSTTAAKTVRPPADRLASGNIQRFLLRFEDSALEAEFRAYQNTTYRRQAWIWCVAAIAVYSALGVVEWLILPDHRELAFIARYAVAFVDFGIGFYLAFGVNYDRFFSRSMPISIGIVFLTTALVYVQMPDMYQDLYLCQYVAAILFLYLHMGLPFRVAATIGWAACAVFAGFTLWADGATWLQQDMLPLAVVITANAMAMFNAHDHELSNRRFFRAAKLLERQKGQEHELQQRLALASRQEAVGRLAGGVAHDFNNLLQVITGSAAFALERAPAVGSVTEQLRLIRKTAQSGAALTRQLLAYSRQRPMDPMPVDLHELLRLYLPALRRVLPETVEVDLHPDAAAATVLADAGMIEQVLLNLAMNARDAMPHGGRLELRTAVVTPTQEELKGRPWAKAGAYVVVSVSDTGAGMEPEVLERAFEPFFTTKDTGSGSGLGLSMAYGILQQHGGMIEAESKPGKGTTFRIHLPQHVSTESELAEREALQTVTAQDSAETVLLVEDNPDLCWVLAEMLRGQGYKVIPALDGEKAWEAYQRNLGEIRLALLDVMLPKTDGYALFARMRAMDPTLPVIFTSGYTGRQTEEPPPGTENVPLLRKPYKNETLYRLIRAQLDQAKAVSAPPGREKTTRPMA